MPLSRREIRSRATRFAREWAGVSSEDAEAKSFWDDFFNVFGVPRRRVASFEHHVKKLSAKTLTPGPSPMEMGTLHPTSSQGGGVKEADGYIDLFWPGKLVVEHKSRGKDLGKAVDQAIGYFHGLKDHELPRYVIVSDFANIRIDDLEEKTSATIALEELPQRIELFDFIAGYATRMPRAQDPVNLKAAELMGQLHDELKANGYDGHALEVYLVRLLFILFADDTGIFELDAFYNFIVDQTREDGTDLGPQLARVFQLLNTPDEKRQKNLDERLADLKYINGKLFAEPLPIADWDGAMRVTLLECASLDWSKISPAIFGALFQSAMDPKQRRNLGAHYTSEANILKLIKPLFLDELWDEFERAKRSRPQLEKFHKKLGELKFLDPACGCGNFLVITYRELRLLEIEVIRALQRGQQVTDVDHLVRLNVDKFYGIEIEDFPAQIAQVAMWLVDHQMNQQVSSAFGEYMVRIPLRHSATIVNANALRTDWQSLLPEGDRYDFILGNPPFIGKHVQNSEQKIDMDSLFRGVKGSGVLDYVSAWFIKASEYIQGTQTKVGFVSTSSIAQGEQAGILWDLLYRRYSNKIHFAHQAFSWSNEAKGKAAVHVVIIGFASFDVSDKRLYQYQNVKAEPIEVRVKNIAPYLIEGSDTVIKKRSKPIEAVPHLVAGNKAIDGGNFIFTDEEKDAFISQEPSSRQFFKRFIGSEEFINNKSRWCLWLQNVAPAQLKDMPLVMERVKNVKELRLKSTDPQARHLANFPTTFRDTKNPSTAIMIPLVSSENREYIPLGFIDQDTVPSNLCSFIETESKFIFGVLTSAMHMSWMKITCGRLESRYRYSNDIVYNNFPWPQQPKPAQVKAVEEAAQAVLDARDIYLKPQNGQKPASLADLYDPLTMPKPLRDAHQKLDRAVDKCYRSQPFASDAKRVEFLFELYEGLVK